ncbi:MAG: lysophospholipid acyltransferase family protein [Candidatus Rokubacteria bacterium]|nr:lysophospholipid acyltransferase family protein [Candidatus Rokubacteria bacterium]
MALTAPPRVVGTSRAVGEIARSRWYAHRWNRSGYYRLAAAVAAPLPRRARLGLAVVLARALRARFRNECRMVRTNIARVAPGATGPARDALVADVFRHFAICFADLVSSNRSPATLERLLAGVVGEEHLTAASREGRGLVVLTAHLGNWELAGRLLALRSARPTHVVVAAEADPRVERFLRAGPAPVRFLARTRPTDVLALVSALRRNEIVAMQGDRALGGRGDVAAPFFGGNASFPLGPFVLARAAGSPLVPAFCVLGRDRRYTISVGEPIRVGTHGEPGALAGWVRVLEDAVRAHPEQWFNFFDVWGDGAAG